MRRLIMLLKMFRRDFLVLLAAAFHRNTPMKMRGVILLVFLYLISPIDLIPDTIPLLGLMDDAVLVPTAVGILMRFLPWQVQADSERRAEGLTRHMTSLLVVFGVVLCLWFGFVCWGIYHLVK